MYFIISQIIADYIYPLYTTNNSPYRGRLKLKGFTLNMISMKLNNFTVNIIDNFTQNSKERDFELLVDYVDAVKEIYDGLNLKKCTKN